MEEETIKLLADIVFIPESTKTNINLLEGSGVVKKNYNKEIRRKESKLNPSFFVYNRSNLNPFESDLSWRVIFVLTRVK